MQLRSGDAATAIASAATRAVSSRDKQIRMLYAGDMDVARAQIASEAPELRVEPLADALADAGNTTSALDADVVFIDCGYARVNAAALIEELRGRKIAIPIVLAMDPGAEDSAKIALRLNADDYTVKSPGWLARLPYRLKVAMSWHRQLAAVNTREERLRTILDAAPACLTRVSRDGTVLAMNDAARGMIGAEQAADVLGKSIFGFAPAEQHEPLRQFIDTVCGGRASSLELALNAPAGDTRTVEVNAVSLAPDAKGRESAFMVIRDISERRRLEASIVENQAPAVDLDAERQVAEAAAKCVALEQQLSTERAQAEVLAARIQQLTTEQEQTASDRSQLQSVQTTLDETRTRHQFEIAHERGIQEQLRVRCEGQRAELEKLQTELGEHVAASEQLERDAHELRRQIEQHAAESQRAPEPQPDEQSAVAETLRSELAQVQQTLRSERKELIRALQACVTLEQLAEHRASQCTTLERTLEEMRVEFARISAPATPHGVNDEARG